MFINLFLKKLLMKTPNIVEWMKIGGPLKKYFHTLIKLCDNDMIQKIYFWSQIKLKSWISFLKILIIKILIQKKFKKIQKRYKILLKNLKKKKVQNDKIMW